MDTWSQWAAAALGTLVLAFLPVHGADTISGIQIREAWIRWLPASLPAGGYVTVSNDSDQPIVLVGAFSPDFGEVQLHRSVSQGGLVHMQPVARISIAAHSTLSFAAQGYHLMLMKPRVPLAPGDHVPITLRFANGQSLAASFQVRSPNAGATGAGQDMGNMPGMPGMPGMAH